MFDNDDVYAELTKNSLKSPLLRSYYVKESEKIAQKHIHKFILKNIEKIVELGYRSAHTGEEILQAISEKKERLVDEAIEDITGQSIATIFKTLEEESEKNPLRIEDYLFGGIARENDTAAQKSFMFLLNHDTGNCVYALQNFEKLAGDISHTREISGAEAIAELYYDLFYRRENTFRELINVPEPEEMMRITI